MGLRMVGVTGTGRVGIAARRAVRVAVVLEGNRRHNQRRIVVV